MQNVNLIIRVGVKLPFIQGSLVAPECSGGSVHLCLRAGAVAVCASLAGDLGEQGGEGRGSEYEHTRLAETPRMGDG